MAWSLLDIAHNATSTASALIVVGFGVAKASTHLGFSIARSIVGLTPIPFLKTSLDHLENFSLLPILLGESIASTSLTAASIAISNYLEINESEASFSLASFVTLVRNEWAELGTVGRSVIEVARAVAAWAAIQGLTKAWNENRWLQYTTELSAKDILGSLRADEPVLRPTIGRRRTISRISVTEDVIIPEGDHQSQVVSADIGEKSSPIDISSVHRPAAAAATSGKSQNGFATPPSKDDRVSSRSNYETWHTLRRLSKIVLAGYGGAGLLFFGAPLQPDHVVSRGHLERTDRKRRSDSEVKSSEEKTLLDTLEQAENNDNNDDSRARTGADSVISGSTHPEGSSVPSSSYSWWNVLLGKHDRDIFERFAFTQLEEEERKLTRSPSSASILSARSTQSTTTHYYSSSNSNVHKDSDPERQRDPTEKSPSSSKEEAKRTQSRYTAVIGNTRDLPRFWVLTDHGRRQVVLVVRGTMSFNDLAVDLTCQPAPFSPATVSTPAASQTAEDVCEAESTVSESLNRQSSSSPYPNYSAFQHSPSVVEMANEQKDRDEKDEKGKKLEDRPAYLQTPESNNGSTDPPYEVHSGMLLLARAMGCKGKPVHDAVLTALSKNPRYELILCGHSLGAGVAALLALMWADPNTCRTVPSSGLPPERRVSVYCFAPPCVTSPSLSRLCRNLITSFVYSSDVVSRLSLGSMRDLHKAAFWLCEGQGEASTISLLRRALGGKLGFGDGPVNSEEEVRWFIAVRKTLEANMSSAHLFPPGKVWWAVRNESLHFSHQRAETCGGLRLFEVHQVEQVFRQIEFKGDMLSSHLPHQYDKALSELEF